MKIFKRRSISFKRLFATIARFYFHSTAVEISPLRNPFREKGTSFDRGKQRQQRNHSSIFPSPLESSATRHQRNQPFERTLPDVSKSRPKQRSQRRSVMQRQPMERKEGKIEREQKGEKNAPVCT